MTSIPSSYPLAVRGALLAAPNLKVEVRVQYCPAKCSSGDPTTKEEQAGKPEYLRRSYDGADILLVRRPGIKASEVLVIRKILGILLILALMATGGIIVGCGGDLPGNAVAKVGETVIKEGDYQKRLEDYAAQLGLSEEESDADTWKAFQLEVLDYLITYEMAVQKAPVYGVTLTDEEVQEEIDNILTIYFDGDKEALEETLKDNGTSYEAWEQNYRESMLLQKVYEKVTENVTEVPEEEIQEYYDTHKDEYHVEETRTTRHILIAPGDDDTATGASSDSTSTTSAPTDADWDKALATAKMVRALLVAGGDWKELAAKYSDDAGTADNGGELGDVVAGEMVPEFEEAVFSLELNEISEPVKTTYGYHIIQVTAINPAHDQTLDEVRSEIEAILLNQKKNEAWQKWIEDTKVELNVIYREDMQSTTTTTTTSSSGESATSSSSSSSSSESTTSTAPATSTSSTAKP